MWFINTLTKENIPIPKIFLETGAYMGDGIQHALDINYFTEIYSIELSEQWYTHCAQRFNNISNVRILLGDSATVLNNIDLPAEPILFYLDAHYSGGETSGQYLDNGCPLLRELDALCGRNINGDVIIIDDMRLMGRASWGGTENDKMYPRTFFDFSHITIDQIKDKFPSRKIISCTDVDRLVIF